MLEDLINSFKTHTIPNYYGWSDRKGLLLSDIGFKHYSDCLNKRYSKSGEPLPPDFDTRLLYRALNGYAECSVLHKFIRIVPDNIILSQKFVKKIRLIELLHEQNVKPIRGVVFGKYTIIHDGHHRLVLALLKNRRIYCKLKIWKEQE